MIDLYLLQELHAFQKYGTLARTASALAVTQPTVSRGMQKLEEELGVKLFNRSPNKVTLTKVGEFAASQAGQLLAANEGYSNQVRRFACSQATITVAANAPGPLIILRSLHWPQISVQSQLLSKNYTESLLNHQAVCLLLNQPLTTPKISSIYLGTENLVVHLNEFTALASQGTVQFADLQNLSFLVIEDIGIWKQIIQQKIPHAKFLYQHDPNNFVEIRNNSIFPFFTTNITKLDPESRHEVANDRIEVKIKDQAAHQQFYACFLKSNKKRLLPLIQAIQDQWAKVD